MLNFCYEVLAYLLSIASTLLLFVQQKLKTVTTSWFTPRREKTYTISRIYPVELIAYLFNVFLGVSRKWRKSIACSLIPVSAATIRKHGVEQMSIER